MTAPVWGERAIYMEEERAIIIADLHIGIEFDYVLQGVNIGTQTDKLIERCRKLITKKKAEKLIVAGDLKHTIVAENEEKGEIIKKERKEVAKFIESLNEICEIWVIKGNHDTMLRSKKLKIFSSKGIKVGDVSLIHGHSWADEKIMDSSLIIAGHIHPFVRIKTEIGYSYSRECWVRGKVKKREFVEKYKNGNYKMDFVIMPAFNPLCGGTAVNRERIDEAIMKIFDIRNANAYLLNGINLGVIKNLM